MNAIQCDQCHQFAADPTGGRRHHFGDSRFPTLPDGWWSLAAGRGTANDIEGEFCSTRCAGLYLLAYEPQELTAAERHISAGLFGRPSREEPI